MGACTSKLAGMTGLDEKQVGAALTNVLELAAKGASEAACAVGGFSNNDAIKIGLPDELEELYSKLKGLGLASQIDDVLAKLNTACEKAAMTAVEVFLAAVKSLEMSDAIGLLINGDTAATQFMKKKCWSALEGTFGPPIRSAVDALNVRPLMNAALEKYNSIPFVKNISFDLDVFVVTKGIEGIFTLMAELEKQARNDPESLGCPEDVAAILKKGQKFTKMAAPMKKVAGVLTEGMPKPPQANV